MDWSGLFTEPFKFLIEKFAKGKDAQKALANDIQDFVNHQKRATHLDIFRFAERPKIRQKDDFISLEAIYIPMRIKQIRATLPPFETHTASKKAHQFEADLNIRDLFHTIRNDDRFRKMLIMGSAGMGKSTFMKYAARLFSERGVKKVKVLDRIKDEPQLVEHRFEDAAVPIFIRLRDLEQALIKHQSPNWLNDFHIEHFLTHQYQLPYDTPQFYTTLLETMPCLLLLDGFDEVAEAKSLGEQHQIPFSRTAVAIWLTNRTNILMERNPKLSVLLTSRHTSDETILKNFQVFEIQRFNDVEMRLFTDYWYAGYRKVLEYDHSALMTEQKERKAEYQGKLAKLEENRTHFQKNFENPRVKTLFENPLLLSLTLLTHSIDQTLSIEDTEQLYDKFVRTFLYQWDDVRQMDFFGTLLGQSNIKRVYDVMHRLAYFFSTQETTVLPVKAFLPTLVKAIQRFNKADEAIIKPLALELLRILRDRTSGLFTAKEVLDDFEETLFEFQHKSFQDYLTAVSIHQDALVQNGVLDLKSKLANERYFWYQTIHFYVNIQNADFFFESFIQTFEPEQDIDKLSTFMGYFLQAKDRNSDLEPIFATKLWTIFHESDNPRVVDRVCLELQLFQSSSVMELHLCPLIYKISQTEGDVARLGHSFLRANKKLGYKLIRPILKYKWETYDLDEPILALELMSTVSLIILGQDITIIKIILYKLYQSNEYYFYMFVGDLIQLWDKDKLAIWLKVNLKLFLPVSHLGLRYTTYYKESNTVIHIYHMWHIININNGWDSWKMQFNKKTTAEERVQMKLNLTHIILLIHNMSEEAIKQIFHNWD